MFICLFVVVAVAVADTRLLIPVTSGNSGASRVGSSAGGSRVATAAAVTVMVAAAAAAVQQQQQQQQ